jgi:hypothetical protein
MTTRRRAALLLSLALLGPGLAACGGNEDEADDAVASLTGDDGGDAEEAADDGDGGGGQPQREMSAEQQDAILEFAQCMRDHGVDMPDPQISEDGGVMIQAGGPGGEGGPEQSGGPGDEEWEAANEACQPIMDAAMPEVEIDPEQQAEMQDRLVAVAECMRARGYDMPDPEVDENGRVTVQMGAPGGGEGEVDVPDDEQQQDMEECQEEAGMEGPGMIGGPPPDGESGDGGGE